MSTTIIGKEELVLIGTGLFLYHLPWKEITGFYTDLVRNWWKKQATSLKKTSNRNLFYLTDKNTKHLTNLNYTAPTIDAFEDVTPIFRFIEEADPVKPIQIVIASRGGPTSNCFRMIRRLQSHPTGYIAYCNECYSAAAILALCANERVVVKETIFGKIDPMIRDSAVLDQANTKDPVKLSEARSCILTMETFFAELMNPNIFAAVKDILFYSQLKHWYCIDYKQIKNLGIDTREPTSEESAYFGYFVK